MDGSASTEILQPVEKNETNLHNGVKSPLKELGHNVSTEPDSQKPIPLTEGLKQIGVDATHIAGSGFDELMSGVGRSSRDRTTHGRNPISIALERAKRLVQKKAA